jgi:hypothetical protein
MASAQQVYEVSRLTLGDQTGLVVVLKAYMDESGVHDGSPVVTVAAYLARPRDWQAWTKRWNAAKRPIKVFHAVDAQNLEGEFKGREKDERDAIVKRILPVIVEAEFPGIVIGIHMDEFRKAIGSRPDLTDDVFRTPYGACFQWLVQSIMYLQARTGNRERIGFVHETNAFKNEALEGFDHIKRYGNPQGTVIGLTFGSKQDCSPLQAADILAYEGNKRLRDPDRPERRPWKVLNPDRRILVGQYGKRNMPDLIRRLELIRDGRMNEISLGDGWVRFLREGF